MKKQKNKKNRSSKKRTQLHIKRVILDTSLQIERIKYEEEVGSQINNLLKNYKIHSSYYALYEFKISIIYSLIQFYYSVIAYGDPSKAIMKMSDKIGRESKNQLIIQGLLHRIVSSISAKEVNQYLRQIEFLVLYCQELFNHQLSGYTGNFSSDPIVKYRIETSEDYEGFVALYKSRKIIPLDSFWFGNVSQLQLLISATELEKNYKELHEKLVEISNDVKKANNYFVNKKIGDAVIAVDCPTRYTIATIDSSYSFLCPPLGKKFIQFEKTH